MIYLVRHGLDDERFVGGWSETPLVYEGVNQIINASNFIEREGIYYKRVVSSDIRRARESARLLNKNGVPYDEVSYLRELNKGDITGLKVSDVSSEILNLKGIYDRYPNGESMYDFYLRIKRDLDKILDKDNALLVTHRGVINMIYFIFNDILVNMDKNQFGVTHASIHEVDPVLRKIRKIY